MFFLNLVSAAFALVAACFWLISAAVKVPIPQEPYENGKMPYGIFVHGMDVGRTMLRQSIWSKRAALAAGVSGVLQACIIFANNSH